MMKVVSASAFVLVAGAAACPAMASCVFTPGRVVQATIVRCESARPYLESAAAVKQSSEDGREGTILIANVQWELRLAPALSGSGISGVKSEREWIRVVEHATLWWNGPSATCTSQVGSLVTLWVHAPCCDLWPPAGACLGDLDHADPPTTDIQQLISKVPPPKKAKR